MSEENYINGGSADSISRTTRRAFLAAGGAGALAGLAGCAALDGLVDRASNEVVGTTEASPAAFYAGHATPASSGDTIGRTDHFRSDSVDVRYVPPTLQADSRRIDIDGWSTSTPTKAQDYNSSRSNKPRTIWWPGPDDESDEDDDTDTLVTVLDMERALSVHLESAINAVDGGSKAAAKRTLDGFINATTSIRSGLDGCPSEVCMIVRENADKQHKIGQVASDAMDANEWDQAAKSLREAQSIVDGDIKRLEDDLDSDGDGLLDATEPLYGYLDGEATIGERFVVSLPDARLRSGGAALADELTPRRVVDYFTGERNAEGCADTDRSVVIHRDLACRDLLSTKLEEEKRKKRHVIAFERSGSAVVTGTSPVADGAEQMLFVSQDGSVKTPETLDTWDEERAAGETTVTPTLVCPVVATPVDCPCPMPALFFVRRIRNDDQVLYAGGWVIDDGALYEDAATLLVSDGPNIVAGVSRSDIEEGGADLQSLVIGGGRKPGRTTYGNVTLRSPYDPVADYMPEGSNPVCMKTGYDYWQVQSREALARGTGDCDDGDRNDPPMCVVTAMDAPILHLVGAAEASNDVKFKAGVELSKAVN